MDNLTKSFIDDFQWAVIRLATLQIKRGEAGRLLFATVTLLTPDRPPPSKMAGYEDKRLGKTEIKVCFRRTVLTAQNAVDWYRSLGENPRTPIPSREVDIEKKIDGVSISVSNFIDDLIWPNLGLPVGNSLFTRPSGGSTPAPFIGNTSARLHRRFGDTEGFDSLLDNDAALAFVARRLHVNLRDYSEYLGSVALVVPDPIIKQIDNFLLPAGDGCNERIFYRFIPRPGQTLHGLKITMFDEQAHLLSNFEMREVPADGIIDVDKGSCFGSYGYVVTHPVHGVLLYHPPVGFLRQIGLKMNIVNQVRKVSVPMGESRKSLQTEYCVSRQQIGPCSIIGEQPTVLNANVRIGVAVIQREKAVNAARFDQRWFGNGTREEAMAFVRARVGRARSRIIVADPYFGRLQVPQYLLAITSDTVKVKIFTSRLAFEGVCTPEDDQEAESSSPAKTPQVEKLEQFNAEIERIKQEGNADVEVMILTGKSPVLHDRFLVVDDEVWFMGNSFNTLGDRASMIIKIPNPDEVLHELEKMFNQAEIFGTYFQRQINESKSIKK